MVPGGARLTFGEGLRLAGVVRGIRWVSGGQFDGLLGNVIEWDFVCFLVVGPFQLKERRL